MTNALLSAPDSCFSRERAWQVVESIANTYAPSQTVAYTRSPAIQRLLAQFNIPHVRFEPNYRNTGNAVLLIGDGRPSIWIFAHADEISYLIGARQDAQTFRLLPYCAHKSIVPQPAVVLRYNTATRGLEEVARGEIHAPDPSSAGRPTLVVTSGSPRTGDRVVFAHRQVLEGDTVEGSIDNAAGASAALLAAMALVEAGFSGSVGFVFTDEEEGLSEHSVSFSRGARRFMRVIDPPELCIVVDGHMASDLHPLGGGALIAEKSSDGASAATPPHLYAPLKQLVESLEHKGIRVSENDERVPRGDDFAIIEATPNILLFGYPTTRRHFDVGPSQASLSDLIALSRLIYEAVVAFAELLKP